jgi:hypothetical protein
MYCSQKLGEDFANFGGLLRIYELYLVHLIQTTNMNLELQRNSVYLLFE